MLACERKEKPNMAAATTNKKMITALLFMFMVVIASAVPDRAGQVTNLQEACITRCMDNLCPDKPRSYAICALECDGYCAGACFGGPEFCYFKPGILMKL
ncbi:unnamed protein product [Ilex paraguariensis]|uniref:Uncharacterized protein n=1 Tax=Ilex paraguariensis TaxID=185542 RepID=A0ABC8RX15_9AQUA